MAESMGAVEPARFATPQSLDAALQLLAAHAGVTLWGGGTDLMISVNFGRLRPAHGLAVRRLDELRQCADGRIGAAVTFGELERSGYRALAEASRTVGSPQIRAAATLGGNLGTASPAGDSLPVLAAYGAEVVLRSAAGSRTLRLDEFLRGPRSTARRDDELIEAVVVPDDLPERQAFAKLGIRNAMAISIVSVCVTRDDSGTTRIALGAVGPTPVRPRRAEELASGTQRFSRADLDEFARLVASEVRPITDHRGTAEYRRHAAGVLATRQLLRCL